MHTDGVSCNPIFTLETANYMDITDRKKKHTAAWFSSGLHTIYNRLTTVDDVLVPIR